LVVADEGVWTVNTDTGEITFTPEAGFTGTPTPIAYTMDDDQGNTSNPAIVMITYTENPLARDDMSLGNAIGAAVTVDVLANDVAAPNRTLVPASVQITGTANPGESLVVAGQGTWSVYTTTGAITFTPEAGFTGNPTPIAYTVDDDQGNTSNSAIVTITYIDKGFFVYLPLAVRYWPPIPATPVLSAISNPDGDGDYTVSWSSTEYATSYVLQESKTSSFSDAVQVYSDTDTTISLSDRGPTRYYYRVQACNIYANSAWSNVRSVDVVWEKEPNDDALTQANGPLVSGLTYYGHFPSGADTKDYFFIYLQSAQSVELWLSNIAAGQDYDLTLRNTALQVVGHSGELGNANEHIRTVTLPAGWYYIQVYNRSGSGSTQAYHLRVDYPATVLTAHHQ
jgi:CshA-type fibril repeat protein